MDLDLEATLLAVCRLAPDDEVPRWVAATSAPLVSITRTRDELSIVVSQDDVPPGVRAETGWRAMSVRGPLPFTLTGILAALSARLADAGVPILAISTFDTDWLLVRDDRLDDATAALEHAGHRVHPAAPSRPGQQGGLPPLG